MKLGSKGTILSAIGMLTVCVLGMVQASGQAAPQQKPQGGQTATRKPQMAEDVFKNVQVLKGIPEGEFLDTMGFFAASLGLNCTDCHGTDAVSDFAKYADDTALKTTARRMILMVNNLNKNNFGGAPRVTCYTCHRGDAAPKETPSLALQNATPPPDDPNEVEIVRQEPGAPSPDQVFNKYLQALGGAQRLASFTSFVAKGTYNGFDTEFEDLPIEVFAKAPAQRTTVIHFRTGDRITTCDGRSGWIAQSGKPMPLIEITGGDLDGAKLDAAAPFPVGIKQVRSGWRAGSRTLDSRAVVVVEGTSAGQPPVKLYFDKESGLLVREVRYTQLPIGRIPTQIDYADYRVIAGVKMPFRWTATWTDGRSTTALTAVQPNAPIDAARFAMPTPAPPPKLAAQ